MEKKEKKKNIDRRRNRTWIEKEKKTVEHTHTAVHIRVFRGKKKKKSNENGKEKKEKRFDLFFFFSSDDEKRL